MGATVQRDGAGALGGPPKAEPGAWSAGRGAAGVALIIGRRSSAVEGAGAQARVLSTVAVLSAALAEQSGVPA
jgi:hypothetical protein